MEAKDKKNIVNSSNAQGFQALVRLSQQLMMKWILIPYSGTGAAQFL
jgi:hypothetical protein